MSVVRDPWWKKKTLFYSKTGAGWISCESYRDGCATSEDTYWKLDALQSFVQDLNWPEEEFARYLQIRMKALASEMINKCANWYVEALIS